MIYGKRIRLRGVERTDIPQFHEWINDPHVNNGLSVYLPQSLTDEQHWFDESARRDQAEKPMAIEIRRGRGWKLVGSCGLFNIEWMNRSCELGIMIGDKSVWNKGYGAERTRLLLQHGFDTLNLNRVYLRVYSSNPRAIRTYEKSGIVLEGTMRQAVYRQGKYADMHIMSVLRSDWSAGQEQT